MAGRGGQVERWQIDLLQHRRALEARKVGKCPEQSQRPVTRQHLLEDRHGLMPLDLADVGQLVVDRQPALHDRRPDAALFAMKAKRSKPMATVAGVLPAVAGEQVRRLEKKVEREETVLAALPELSLQIVELAREHGRVTRDDAQGPLQVVSGPIHRRKVHYEAPPAHRLQAEMSGFLNWFNRGLDVTDWLEWFLACLLRAVQGAEETLAQVLAKARFWQHWAGVPMNDRQINLLNTLLDGFEGKLTSSTWAAIGKCSQDTALRDITELLERGVLKKSAASGRSTSYELMRLGGPG